MITERYLQQYKHLSMRILDQTFGRVPLGDVRIRLWDGTLWPDDGPHKAAMVLNHPGALRSMLMPGSELGLAEAYLRDDFDIDGSIEAVIATGYALLQQAPTWKAKLEVAAALLRLPETRFAAGSARGAATLTGAPHSPGRDRQAISYHYDVSNDFYRLWLDDQMVYSCAYFRDPAEELDQAQENKLAYLCRKLRLGPGQRLLDIGCGWGGLALHAARQHGALVTGITLSEPQAAEARHRARALGVADRVDIRVQDYREVREFGHYDALVSVGMFEHVGQARLARYFDIAYRLLRPGGVFLNHGIADWGPQPGGKEPTFVQRYVFPDGELTAISTSLRLAEEAGFEVRDVESLREHYALTLRHWVQRLERRHAEALRWVDEPTYRTWRLFMAGSAHGFAVGKLNVYQSLLVKQAKGGASALPLTREDWYR